ncbi:hypothetical protein BGY98DRAFT_1100075 [Russula aff. rugulosa BPL654]|nr:hypothetical protein BGY98DRAFT_1100075 [Russula aff. rugulosa BPL654]
MYLFIYPNFSLFPHAAPSSPPIRVTHTYSLEKVPPLYGGRRAPLSLNIIIVGAGIAGLAATHTLAHAGHRITLLESASVLSGRRGRYPSLSNATRLLRRWGLGQALAAVGVEPTAIVFRRYDTGSRVGYTRWGTRMLEDHGSPTIISIAGITMRCSTVSRAPPWRGPSVTLASGEVLYADVIIGADGVKSHCRKTVTGLDDAPIPTGDAAPRAAPVGRDPRDDRVDGPEAPSEWLTTYAQRRVQLGIDPPRRRIGRIVDRGGSGEKMRADFADFEPSVQKLLSFVKSTLKWRLMDRKPLDTWVHPQGRLTLLGDACHPMLPYRAQGAAIAVEDAAVLGALFSRVSSLSQVPALLRAYQDLRFVTRATATQESSRLNQKIFHLLDGPDQRARDNAMRAAMAAELEGRPIPDGNPNQWADRTKNRIQFDYDAYAEVERWWASGGREQIEALGGRSHGGHDSSVEMALKSRL